MNRIPMIVGLAVLWEGVLIHRPAAEIIAVPVDFGSVRVYPNPWRADRDSDHPVSFADLPDSAVTILRIFTIAGEHVRTLSGTREIPWDLSNQHGDRVASGVYLYLLTTHNQQKSGKIAVIR
jgi:hypothetical protein